MHMQERK